MNTKTSTDMGPETDLNAADPHEFEKFVLYIYLWAAYSNYNLEKEEIHIVREKLGKHNLITPAAFDKYYHGVLSLFHSHNDYECQQYIEKSIDHLKLDENMRRKIYEDIKDIIHGEKIHDEESMQLLKFRRILNIHKAK